MKKSKFKQKVYTFLVPFLDGYKVLLPKRMSCTKKGAIKLEWSEEVISD